MLLINVGFQTNTRMYSENEKKTMVKVFLLIGVLNGKEYFSGHNHNSQ